ncbi:MAG: hypothetical protein HY263_08730 [Chloroflexi bacterium]|nr:hypothetical protein [Chloroflexota bacterium]
MTNLVLAVRAHRFETLAVGLFAVASLGGAALVVVRLMAYGIPASCFRGTGPSLICQGLSGDMDAYLSIARDWGFFALAGIVLLPIVSGLFLGIAMAGKEIDRGTTVFAWSLAPSRRRWLVQRVAPAALAVVVAGLIGGFFGDQLEALRDPGTDPATTFGHLGLRGPVIAGEALAVFGLALAAGAVLGRILPALLVAAALSVGAIAGVNLATDAWLHHETVAVLGVDDVGNVQPSWRVVDYRVLAPDGAIITWNEAYARYGDPGAPQSSGGPVMPDLKTVLFVNPGEIYPLVVARMTLLFAALGLAGIVLAFAVVDRRRP